MMATYNNNAHPLPSAPLGGASMQPPPPQHQHQQPFSQPQTTTVHYPQTKAAPNAQASHSQNNTRTASMARDRRSRGLSFRSDKSHHSGSGSISTKLEPETHAEKEAKRLHSKADPSLAIIEAEPSAVAATAKTMLAPLRSITHRDNFGNPIAEPDFTNPTRSRWERPLDTIRSFEAAIDGGYSRKSSIPDTAADNNNNNNSNNFSRRNSYFSVQGANPPPATGNTPGNGGPRYPQDSYYRAQQPHMSTSNSAYDLRQNLHGRDSYYDYQGAPPQLQGQNRQRYSRNSSEPQIHGHLNRPDQNAQNAQNVYPGGSSNHRSYETVASGSGSNGEPAGYQTDLTSSDNSSIERRQSPGKMAMGPGGPGGPGQFNRRPSPMNDLNGGYGYNNNNLNANNSYSGYNGPKAPQIQLNGAGANNDGLTMAATKNVITRKTTGTSATAAPLAPTTSAGLGTAAADKRKSWLSRKFSKKN
ncbi:hypothetical protein F503_03211 [Ophiostoma piceae UAMH 11346]|uniref:Uncharacterized protein n=1 Tax=Ophiostoma piceae (strain UAMH 11346) TaxID=1262450 RepID=S3BZT6_OPHP1|nr:hypothetical protein F503_03211 [Ophiostoma piceae UAMH 11346]